MKAQARAGFSCALPTCETWSPTPHWKRPSSKQPTDSSKSTPNKKKSNSPKRKPTACESKHKVLLILCRIKAQAVAALRRSGIHPTEGH